MGSKRYAQVILPLPLFASFTYEVPEGFQDEISVGTAVLVQFGKKKFYTGIVESFIPNPPGNYELKPIMALLYGEPIVRYPQLKLWDWISSYYLCSTGDVFKAAVPAGLKPESETWLSLNPDYEYEEDAKFSEKELMIIQYLEDKKRAKLQDIENQLKINKESVIISRLLTRGVLEVSENINSRYRPKKLTCIRLNVDREDTEALHGIMEGLSRARQQELALMAYLELSGWLRKGEKVNVVTREQLLERSGVSSAVVSALAQKGIFEIYKRTENRFNNTSDEIQELTPLSELQADALQKIQEQWREKNVVLCRGVTGSGKTEIYIHLIKNELDKGNQVLYLVPEIALTTQLTDRLRKVFGNRLLVYHSRFSDNDRVDIWKKLLVSNEPLVIIGARSAVFLPFGPLGMVVVDEEHDASYKQNDPAPRYNGRDTAIMLASMHGAKTLLGSATPSIETYYKATTGKYGLVEIESRYDDSPLPDVSIVDMRRQRKERLNSGILSSTLRETVESALEGKKQTILFQNRRGFAPMVICRACGWTPKCQNCDVSMVYHKYGDSLHCHYCGHTAPMPSVCPACGQNMLEILGYGTERIEEDIQNNFPGAEISRMDLDTTRNKDAYHDIISDFSDSKTDILVGTQMVTKGLDFGNVKIVGILNADTVLNFPDFRSNEKGFNTLEQVAGRAGRRKEKGTVIIQTNTPENPILNYVKRHDYLAYYEAEIEERKALNYPPFSRIIMVYIKNREEAVAEAAAEMLGAMLRDIFGERVLGPDKPFISRISTYYYRRIMLKIENEASMPKVKSVLRKVYESVARDPRIKSSILYYDVDPN